MNADTIKAMIGNRAKSYRDRASIIRGPNASVYELIAMTLETMLDEINDGPTDNAIHLGDKITYRPGWGHERPRQAIVTGIEVTEYPREKSGEVVTQVSHGIVMQNRAVFSLDHCSWCYSSQVDLGEVAA